MASVSAELDHASMTTPDPKLERFPAEPYPRGGPGCGVVLIHPDGQRLVTECEGEVQVRAIVDGRVLRAWPVYKPLTMALSLDGALLVVGSRDDKIRLFDVESGKPIGENDGLGRRPEGVCWLPDGQHFAAISDSGRLLIGHRDAAATAAVHELSEKGKWTDGLAVVPGTGHCIVSSLSRLWRIDLADGGRRWQVDVGDAYVRFYHVAIAPQGDRGVVRVGTRTGDELQFFSVATGAFGPRYRFNTGIGITWPEFESSYIRWDPTPVFSPDGRVVACNTPVGTLVLVDPDTGAPLWEAQRAPGMAFVGQVAWLSDSNHLVLGCADDAITLWRMRPLHWVLRVPAKGS
jgi:WD40 repeat protein